MQYGNIEMFCYKDLMFKNLSEYVDIVTENYAWRHDIVFLSDFYLGIWAKIFKTIQHIKTWYSSIFFCLIFWDILSQNI